MDCTVSCKTRELNAEERLERFKKHVGIKQFPVSTCQALVQTQPCPEKTSICSRSSCHHRTFRCGLKVLAKRRGQSVFTKFRAASCHCFAPCPCFACCNCCHDPFIVRSAQPRPPFTGFSLHIRLDVHD